MPIYGNQIKELDFEEFLNIVKKRKKIIVSLFFLGCIFGVVWFFNAPSKYTGNIVLEIGDVKGESVLQIVRKIQGGTYGSYSGVSVRNPLETKLIEITLSDESYEKTKEDLLRISQSIIEDNNNIIDKNKEDMEDYSRFLKDEISAIEKDIVSLRSIGQETGALRAKTYDFQLLYYNNERELDSIKPTTVSDGPSVSESRTPYLFIILGAAGGLLIGLVLAFLKEWIFA
jgi:hypothetical protein